MNVEAQSAGFAHRIPVRAKLELCAPGFIGGTSARGLAPLDGAHGAVWRSAIRTTAQYLRNTPTVCRKSYVHPAMIESFLNGWLLSQLDQLGAASRLRRPNLPADEASVFQFLKCVANR